MSACDDGHTKQPCPGCGTCIFRTSGNGRHYWGEHDYRVEHTRERCQVVSGVAKLVEAAKDLLDYVEHDARIRREESGLTLSGLAVLTEDLRAALAAAEAEVARVERT